jgi:nucleotide-binding universal stress UspA family protein
MHVLLATDGSDDARKATIWLRDLPLPAESTIRILGVAPLPHSALDIPPVREFNEAQVQAVRHAADRAHAVLGNANAEVRVVEGEPRETIVRDACDWPADLTVVGARGLSPMGRFLLGSVSTAVLHGAPGAVAIVRGAPRRPRRILVACDGSAHAFDAIRLLRALHLGRGTTVRVLGVVAPLVLPAGGPEMLALPWPPTDTAFIEEQKSALSEVLARAEAELGPEIGAVDRWIVVGHPASEIVTAAEKTGADLVVVGARGLGAFGRFMLGSVSDRVVHHAPCAVVVVKGKA